MLLPEVVLDCQAASRTIVAQARAAPYGHPSEVSAPEPLCMDEVLDPELLAELGAIFREEASERLAALRAQVTALQDPALADRAAVYVDARREAHTLKGSAGTVGADDVRSVSLRLEKRLELYARAGATLAEADAKILNDLCDRLDAALAAF